MPACLACRGVMSQYLSLFDAAGKLSSLRDAEFVAMLQLMGRMGAVRQCMQGCTHAWLLSTQSLCNAGRRTCSYAAAHKPHGCGGYERGGWGQLASEGRSNRWLLCVMADLQPHSSVCMHMQHSNGAPRRLTACATPCLRVCACACVCCRCFPRSRRHGWLLNATLTSQMWYAWCGCWQSKGRRGNSMRSSTGSRRSSSYGWRHDSWQQQVSSKPPPFLRSCALL